MSVKVSLSCHLRPVVVVRHQLNDVVEPDELGHVLEEVDAEPLEPVVALPGLEGGPGGGGLGLLEGDEGLLRPGHDAEGDVGRAPVGERVLVSYVQARAGGPLANLRK